MMSIPHFARYSLIVALVASVCSAAEEFSLEVPGQPQLTSQAMVDDVKLVIVDASGKATVYARDRSVDSRDGRYLGYYSSTSRRYIRFPKSGSGRMHLADRGTVVTWRESQMQVRRVAVTNPAGPGRVVTNRPVPTRGDPFANNNRSRASANFAVLPRGNQFTVASFGQNNSLQLYSGAGRQWQTQTLGSALAFDTTSSIILADNPGARSPVVYGVSNRGELIRLANGRDVNNVFGRQRNAPTFVRGTQLTTLGANQYILAVDDRARCLLIDPAAGDFLDLGPFRAQAIPGSRAVAVRDANNQVHVFLNDRSGQIVRLSSDQFGRWDDSVVATGYQPGGYVTAQLLSGSTAQQQIYLASIDSRGAAQVLREPFRQTITVGGLVAQPGAAIRLAQQPRGELTVVAIDRTGRLVESIYDTAWMPRVIGTDFIARSPLWYRAHDPAVFGFNSRGELISGRYYGGTWDCFACGTFPGLVGYVPPRVISSETIPLPPLPPVKIKLTNRRKEDLVIQWVDAKHTAGQSETLKIAAGTSITKVVNRDAGARQIETIATQHPNGTVLQDRREYAIPPQSLYTLGVYENRVQSVYIDRTGKDPNPRQETKGLRSIGVFRLPPGDLLQEGTEIDVYRDASRNNNAGAVRLLP